MLSRPHTPTRPPLDDRAHFEIRVDLAVGRVAVIGRLDRRTAHLLRDAFSALLHVEHMRWQLDVTEVTDVDDAGLRAVGAAYRRALRHGRHLTLHGVPPDFGRPWPGCAWTATSSTANWPACVNRSHLGTWCTAQRIRHHRR